jgi:radical SAM protein with 4Fe4S-binding SPASM domain
LPTSSSCASAERRQPASGRTRLDADPERLMRRGTATWSNPMIASEGTPVRYNKEYFGYIAAFPSGEIVLTQPSAGPLLRRRASLQEIEPHLLPTLEVREGFHLETPVLIWMELTRRCNLKCEHCFIDGGEARENELPASEVYRLLDEFAAMGVWGVSFTGGEPTLHPEFSNFVNYARKINLLVGIATNGMFLTPALLDSLPRDGVIVSVSLDQLHIDGNRDFDVATKAILRSQEHGFLTNIMTNTNSRNIHHLGALMNWAEANGVSVRSVPVTPLGRGKLNRHLENSVDDVDVAAKFWMRETEWERKYHQKSGLCVGLIFNYGITLGHMTRRCSSGRYLCYVCADGTVYPCTMCAGEQILAHGNVRGRPFAEFWREEWQIRRYCWDNFRDTCNGCVLNDPQYYCYGRCPATSHARNNRLFGCGSSPFEKLSLITRTAMLQGKPLEHGVGRLTGTPEPDAPSSKPHKFLPMLV